MKNISLSICCLLLSIAANAQYNITLFAGTGSASPGDGLPATSVSLGTRGVCMAPSGDVIIATPARIRKVTVATGIITTIAGGGTNTGENVPATDAAIYLAVQNGLCSDHWGNMYIAPGNVIRKIDAATGLVKTIAGNGTMGMAGDGGPATAAELTISSLAVDDDGNVYVSTYDEHIIRKVDAATGIITRYAGTGTFGTSGDGGAATAAQLYYPHSLAVDASGDLYIGCRGGVRKINKTTGIITKIAGGGMMGEGIPATNANVNDVWGIAVDNSGNIYISDQISGLSFKVRKIMAATGIINKIGGDGPTPFDFVGTVPANDVSFRAYALAVNPSGSAVYVTAATSVLKLHTPGTGIGEMDAVSIANVVPNPSRGSLHLATNIDGEYNVVITNVYGQRIYSAVENNKQVDIKLGDTIPGVYLLTVSRGDQRQSIRVWVTE